MGANWARTPEWTVWVTLLGVRIAVVPHLIVPSLDMVGGGAVPKVTASLLLIKHIFFFNMKTNDRHEASKRFQVMQHVHDIYTSRFILIWIWGVKKSRVVRRFIVIKSLQPTFTKITFDFLYCCSFFSLLLFGLQYYVSFFFLFFINNYLFLL